MADYTIVYRIYLTPKISARAYGDEVEITDRVIDNKVGKIDRSIDSQDFAIGVYSINSVRLECDNSDGFFGDDSRSGFVFSRDLAKVRIVWEKRLRTGTNGENYTVEAETHFRGLIDDEDSRIDPQDDTISLQVVSRDSVIRKSKVNRDAVSDGNTFTQALVSMLGTEDITSVLNFNAGDVNVDYNGSIDDASKFDEKPKKQALEELLGVSNSYLFIDETDTIVIKSRAENTLKAPLKLFGKNDPLGRENILSIKNYNSGLHRTFNSIAVNDSTRIDQGSIDEYGFRRRKYDIPWMTAGSDEPAKAANALLTEFRFPKTELVVEVETKLIEGYDLLDRVTIGYPLRVWVAEGFFLPIVGHAIVGDPLTPVAEASGSVTIPTTKIFKIIEIGEDPKTFTCELKLREVGTELSEGVDAGLFWTTLYARLTESEDADWGDGSLNGTLSGGAAISGGYLNLAAASNGDYLSLAGLSNASKLVQAGAVEITYTPDYTGSPAARRPIVEISKQASSARNLIRLTHETGGGIKISIYNKAGVAIVDYTTGAFAPTAGESYRFSLQFDVSLGETRLFVDGTQLGTTQTGTGLRDDSIGLIRIGALNDGTLTPDAKYSFLQLFNNVIHTADYEAA